MLRDCTPKAGALKVAGLNEALFAGVNTPVIEIAPCIEGLNVHVAVVVMATWRQPGIHFPLALNPIFPAAFEFTVTVTGVR